MKRTFHPGDEWLYFRLYGGPESIENCLLDIVPELVSELEDRKLAGKWFFIRYLDTAFHIRLRFQIFNPDVIGEIILLLKGLINDFLDEGIIWKTEIGTYEREIERYGEDWVEAAEEIFHIDSRFWINALTLMKDDEDEGNKRWEAALLSADSIFDSFNQDYQQRIDLLGKMVNSLSGEMGGGRKLRLQIDEKFRKSREYLEGLISGRSTINIHGFYEVLNTRHDSISSLIQNDPAIPDWDNKLVFRRISDIIHMSLNRGLRSKHRMHELVIYSFLRKLYISLLARNV